MVLYSDVPDPTMLDRSWVVGTINNNHCGSQKKGTGLQVVLSTAIRVTPVTPMSPNTTTTAAKK